MGQRTVLASSIVGAIFAAIVLAVLRRGDHLPILYYVGYASLGYTPVVYMYMNLGNWLFGNVAAREFGQSAGLTIALMMLYIH